MMPVLCRYHDTRIMKVKNNNKYSSKCLRYDDAHDIIIQKTGGIHPPSSAAAMRTANERKGGVEGKNINKVCCYRNFDYRTFRCLRRKTGGIILYRP